VIRTPAVAITTRPEQKDDLVQRRIRLDVDHAERGRTDQHADDQEQHNVGNFYLLGQQAGQRAYGENERPGHQGMFGNFDRGRCFQAKSPLPRCAIRSGSIGD
jgi:hypothetical protein